MINFKFNIPRFMLVILLISASLAFLIRPSELEPVSFFTSIIILILLSILIVLSRETRGLKGFVIFSVSYIWILLV